MQCSVPWSVLVLAFIIMSNSTRIVYSTEELLQIRRGRRVTEYTSLHNMGRRKRWLTGLSKHRYRRKLYLQDVKDTDIQPLQSGKSASETSQSETSVDDMSHKPMHVAIADTVLKLSNCLNIDLQSTVVQELSESDGEESLENISLTLLENDDSSSMAQGQGAKNSNVSKASDFCCVPQCHNSRKATNSCGRKVSYFRFPKATNVERKAQLQKWMQSIKRETKGKKIWRPTQYLRICSEHFVGGTYSRDPNSEYYQPTLFKFCTPKSKARQTITSNKAEKADPSYDQKTESIRFGGKTKNIENHHSDLQ